MKKVSQIDNVFQYYMYLLGGVNVGMQQIYFQLLAGVSFKVSSTYASKNDTFVWIIYTNVHVCIKEFCLLKI